MRIGLLLLVVSVVAIASALWLRADARTAARPASSKAAAPSAGPTLQGRRAAGDAGVEVAPPPTEGEVREHIASILAGTSGWAERLDRLDDPRIDFSPHLGAILAACHGHDPALCSRAVKLLQRAIPAPRYWPRSESLSRAGLGPEGTHPLGPEHRPDVTALLRAEVRASSPFPVYLVLRELTRLGPSAHELVPAIIAWFGRARAALQKTHKGRALWHGFVRHTFCSRHSVIGHFGPSALPHLEVIAADDPQDEDWDLLFFAVDVMMYRATTPTLVAWLGDSNPSLRRSAARVVARSDLGGSDELRAALEARLNDPNEKVREAVAAGLATLLPGTADVIGRILAGKDEAARTGALTGISTRLNHTTPALRDQLLGMMREHDYREAGPLLQVAMAWSESGGLQDLSPLAAGLLHVMNAADSLYSETSICETTDRRERLWRGMGAPAWPHLWKGLHSEDRGVPLAAAWAMAWNGAPDAVHRRLLERWLVTHPRSAFWVPIAAALGDPEEAAVVRALNAGLRSGDYMAASIAALGLQRFGGAITNHLPALAGAVEAAHEIRFCHGPPTHAIERLDFTLAWRLRPTSTRPSPSSITKPRVSADWFTRASPRRASPGWRCFVGTGVLPPTANGSASLKRFSRSRPSRRCAQQRLRASKRRTGPCRSPRLG